jgi:hypothetical protein
VIARLFAGAVLLLAAIGIARADEPRTVPAVGTKLTYRLISTTKTADKTLAVGQVYTYIVTSSDGTTAEGVIKPVAMIIGCQGGAADLGCKDAAKTPGAHFDGDLLTVPIASDAGDGLATHSGFKLTHFMLVSRKFPMPSSRDPKEYNLSDFGPEPSYILTNTMQCDLAGLAGFLPFGKSQQVTLPCETSFERSASRDGRLPLMTTHDTVSMEISYAGSGWVTVPSGNWQVVKMESKVVPKEPDHPSSDIESLFSTQLGATVRSHMMVTDSQAHTTIENTIELISVAP